MISQEELDEAVREVRGLPMEPRPCVCGRTGGVEVATIDRYGFPLTTKLCECGVMRSDPYYTESALDEFYRKHYRTIYSRKGVESVYENETVEGEGLAAFIKEWVGEPESVIEIGCGAGGILKAFKNARGCDVDAEYVEYGKSKGHDISLGWTVDGEADVVIANQVLEHAVDPVATVEKWKPLVGKYLVVSVPGIEGIPVMYGTNLLAYLQNAHVYHYTMSTLKYVMACAGFRLVIGNNYIVSVWEKAHIQLPVPEDGERVMSLLASFNNTFQCAENISVDQT